ncbi:MAG: peptidylprolyl isomerase [Deltaproteobacteria bacterium]|nr:peptidylprolyl isomerase [Deltaproteobacteria bacterium]
MQRLHRSAVVVLAALVAFTLAATLGCPKKSEGSTDQPAAADPTGPVARVNGQDIPRAEFSKQMERTRARFQRAGRQIAPQLEGRLKENLIRKMVEEELIAQKAKAEGVTIDAAELEAKLAEHKARFGSDKAFSSFLERTQQSEADVKADLEKNLLRDKLFAKLLAGQEPTEADAEKYYGENKDKYLQKEQITAQHILLKTDKDTTDAQKKEKLALAKKLTAEAKKQGADFGEIAKRSSEGPTAARGGDLGTFSRGRMVKQFEDAAFAAKAGDIVGPVETQFGYHVIKVNEKTEEKQRTFEDVKETILTSLKARQKSKATRELLEQLRTQAKIELLEPGVSLDAKKPPITADGKPIAPGDLNKLRQEAAAANAKAEALDEDKLEGKDDKDDRDDKEPGDTGASSTAPSTKRPD